VGVLFLVKRILETGYQKDKQTDQRTQCIVRATTYSRLMEISAKQYIYDFAYPIKFPQNFNTQYHVVTTLEILGNEA
jgi:hypothetical protein